MILFCVTPECVTPQNSPVQQFPTVWRARDRSIQFTKKRVPRLCCWNRTLIRKPSRLMPISYSNYEEVILITDGNEIKIWPLLVPKYRLCSPFQRRYVSLLQSFTHKSGRNSWRGWMQSYWRQIDFGEDNKKGHTNAVVSKLTLLRLHRNTIMLFGFTFFVPKSSRFWFVTWFLPVTCVRRSLVLVLPLCHKVRAGSAFQMIPRSSKPDVKMLEIALWVTMFKILAWRDRLTPVFLCFHCRHENKSSHSVKAKGFLELVLPVFGHFCCLWMFSNGPKKDRDWKWSKQQCQCEFFDGKLSLFTWPRWSRSKEWAKCFLQNQLPVDSWEESPGGGNKSILKRPLCHI